MEDYEDDGALEGGYGTIDVTEFEDFDLSVDIESDAIDLYGVSNADADIDGELYEEGEGSLSPDSELSDFDAGHPGLDSTLYQADDVDLNSDSDEKLHGMSENDSSVDAELFEADAAASDSGVEQNEDGMDEIREWIGEVNPQYDPYDLESPYGENCGSCAAATWDRFNGVADATASDNTLSVQEMEDHTGCHQVEASPDEIEAYVQSLGPGGHAVVGIDRVEGPGHWFNAYTPDGEHVYYVDGQTGIVSGWPPTDLGNVAKWDVSYKNNDDAGEVNA